MPYIPQVCEDCGASLDTGERHICEEDVAPTLGFDYMCQSCGDAEQMEDSVYCEECMEKLWLLERLNGIGASEAAAVLGMSPYMTNEQLWEIKTRRTRSTELSSNPFVKYGKAAEHHLRGLFALDFPQYAVKYQPFDIIRNREYPFVFATLDGSITDVAGTPGVLEIKTSEILNSSQWGQWDGRIPQQYYIQCLHQLLATGWDFVILKAQIKHRKGDDINLTTRHYRIDRRDVESELEMLLAEEKTFWECVKQDRRPNRKLPPI